MRLNLLEDNSNYTGAAKWLTPLLQRMSGSIPGPIAVAAYNRSFFGAQWSVCLHKGMSQPQTWSRGEVELFAAFVSRLNECAF
ncbi:MAG: hypothetical protein MI924_17650 [Chloroflexales bacterium]|nr:hypothetical protein [Chloroflexales bacterium]